MKYQYWLSPYLIDLEGASINCLYKFQDPCVGTGAKTLGVYGQKTKAGDKNTKNTEKPMASKSTMIKQYDDNHSSNNIHGIGQGKKFLYHDE